MSDLSTKARQFLACFFGLGGRCSINSHEPHQTLTSWDDVHRELEAAGLVKIEPFNRYGSITITPTPAGVELAKTERQKSIREALDGQGGDHA